MTRSSTTGAHSNPPAVLPANRVRIADASMAVVVPPGRNCAQPNKIELVQQNGVVRAIDIQCGCGQQIRLLCDYE